MATLGTPLRGYNVDNCLCGYVDTRDQVNKNEPEHADEYYRNPTGFYMEVFKDTRTNIEVPSMNNPIEIRLTGDLRNLEEESGD